jgi:hypothetical protein
MICDYKIRKSLLTKELFEKLKQIFKNIHYNLKKKNNTWHSPAIQFSCEYSLSTSEKLA